MKEQSYFLQLYNEHYKTMLLKLKPRLLNQFSSSLSLEDIEDLFQEAWFYICKKQECELKTVKNFGGWFRTILYNKACDRVKAEKRFWGGASKYDNEVNELEKKGELKVNSPIDESIKKFEDKNQIEVIAKYLTAKEQRLFYAYLNYDKSEDIAKELYGDNDNALNRLRTRKHRLFKKIKHIMKTKTL